ncbi:hypothetical protein FB465_0380 [Kitasatospora atroaurantiaca]|uniref:Uncharacterized protein n=1 Tax=Kitasatospora atroaurantiaca TaxID=285545 RepID=A0A561EIS3_9ACTN|nr:hypothetical protein FB465_0380 [Kitasatospora atroaurantiaca]
MTAPEPKCAGRKARDDHAGRVPCSSVGASRPLQPHQRHCGAHQHAESSGPDDDAGPGRLVDMPTVAFRRGQTGCCKVREKKQAYPDHSQHRPTDSSPPRGSDGHQSADRQDQCTAEGGQHGVGQPLGEQRAPVPLRFGPRLVAVVQGLRLRRSHEVPDCPRCKAAQEAAYENQGSATRPLVSFPLRSSSEPKAQDRAPARQEPQEHPFGGPVTDRCPFIPGVVTHVRGAPASCETPGDRARCYSPRHHPCRPSPRHPGGPVVQARFRNTTHRFGHRPAHLPRYSPDRPGAAPIGTRDAPTALTVAATRISPCPYVPRTARAAGMPARGLPRRGPARCAPGRPASHGPFPRTRPCPAASRGRTRRVRGTGGYRFLRG